MSWEFCQKEVGQHNIGNLGELTDQSEIEQALSLLTSQMGRKSQIKSKEELELLQKTLLAKLKSKSSNSKEGMMRKLEKYQHKVGEANQIASLFNLKVHLELQIEYEGE